MKKYHIILIKSCLLLLFIIVGTSCLDLTEDPEGKLTPSSFYKTPDQCEAALAGSLTPLWSTWGGPYTYDDNNLPSGQSAWYNSGLGYSSGSGNIFWTSYYKCISNVNPVIASISNGNLDTYPEDVRNDIMGQAKFLRAFYYFTLVRYYGNIPFIDENTADPVSNSLTPESRIEIADVYAKIVEDLEYAEENMYDRDAATPGKPNKWTAKALLSKVYLTMATNPLNQADKFALARDKADEVIVNGPYSLVPNIVDVFKTSNNNNSETIFAFQTSELYPSVPGINTAPDEWGGWWSGQVKVPWAEAYPEQPRKHIYLLCEWPADPYNPEGDWIEYHNSNAGTPWNGKRTWPNLTLEENLTDAGNSNYIQTIIRLADIYLVYAEAANMANGGPTQLAVDRLNRIIDRANTPGISPNPKTSIPGVEERADVGMSKTEFDNKVIAERDYELSFELDRYFDLLRKKLLYEANLPDDVNDFVETDYLLPIPALDATYIGNNPGY